VKIVHTFLLLFLFFVGFSQEKNSLLWEISGNDLKQSSYLYGTMHVSKKIAFRLDDIFYDALNKSDIIALESDPNTWLEDDVMTAKKNVRSKFAIKGFYSYPFLMKNPKKEMLGAYISFEDRLINNILYRTNPMSQDFEEETYLDMFIYQAGKKYGKPIVALEDLEESSALVGRASLNAIKQKPAEWLQKKMQEEDPMLLLQNAYRERNINLLDSIDQGMYTEHYLKNMLYIRNENMVCKLDSVMQTGKVFTGIGAAHLPGKKGVISLLRNKGYKVTPLISKTTYKGDKFKEELKSKKGENIYKYHSVDDNAFSLLLPNKLYPIVEYVNTTYISPNLVNGSYFMANRIPTYSFLKKENTYTINDIDELLFENIPGEIIEKKVITNTGYKGLDIKNKLKNGDYQRYHIYKTPLEILIFKMGGEGDYVTKHSDTIFNSIKFRSLDTTKVVLTPGFKDFEIEMPSYYTFPNKYRNGNRIIEGYDKNTDSYYFLRKARLNDFNFIEEDTFELKQIQKRFYEDLQLDPSYNSYKGNSLISKARFNAGKKEYLHLKTVINQGDYYLLGTLTKEENNAKRFFNSFKLKEVVYNLPFEKVNDTALFFTTKSTVKPPKFVESSKTGYQRKKKPKPYSAYTKKTVYQNKNGEAITVELNKSHDYLMFPSIDSVWALRKKIYADKKFKISNEKTSVSHLGFHELQLTLTDTASVRGVLVKNISKGGALYEVKAIIDTIQKPSKFVREFFNNFKPSDSIIGNDILNDKTTAFFTALKKNDSIILEGHRFLLFNKQHIDSLKYYISNFEFKEEQQYIQDYLIDKMGQIKDPRVISFFRDFYTKSYNNSTAQTKILQTVSKKSNAASITLLLDLMSKDLPLVSSSYETTKIFKPYLDSLPLAKKLYPEVLEYSGIEEYKGPIFSILAKLKTKNYIKPKVYKSYRKQILNDAKIQLKRHLGASKTNTQKLYVSPKQKKNNKILEDYILLLHPFIKEPGVALFFKRLMHSKDPNIKTSYTTLMIDENNLIPSGMLDSLAGDINSRLLLFNKLKAMNKLVVFPKKYASKKSLAEAALFQKKNIRNKGSHEFVIEKPIKYKNENYTGYYFKYKKESEYDKNYKLYLAVYKNEEELESKPFYKNNGYKIEDTDTDEEIIDLVTEQFLLKDRKRAMVKRKNKYNGYNYFGY